MGIDGCYASKCLDMKNGTAQKEPRASFISELVIDHSATGGVKREQECVMCLSEEMSVLFMPCAHQVVCKTCNELHEKQGMQDCPSCRSPIQQRIAVRFPRIWFIYLLEWVRHFLIIIIIMSMGFMLWIMHSCHASWAETHYFTSMARLVLPFSSAVLMFFRICFVEVAFVFFACLIVCNGQLPMMTLLVFFFFFS